VRLKRSPIPVFCPHNYKAQTRETEKMRLDDFDELRESASIITTLSDDAEGILSFSLHS
jgi:hypothetical protein